VITTALFASVETALNRTLELDPATLKRLEPLSGSVIAIELEGAGLRLYIRPHAGGVDLMGDYEGTVDTTLRGTPMALLRMSHGKPGEGLFGDGVSISGNIELGQRLQRIMGQLDIDWEEHLSHLTGDIIAHQFGEGFRTLRGWTQRNSQSCERDISEFLRFETDSLPLDWEVGQFMDGVDQLRSDLDRLQARIGRLAK
jgi:ubiquinone biosynthesis protein UbiJ